MKKRKQTSNKRTNSKRAIISRGPTTENTGEPDAESEQQQRASERGMGI